MSWFLAFLGFAALIILHEAGHFFAAKAVGMRVERFALFFPPLIARRKRGETEYAIGAIPLGGYVKITGMNPAEEIPPEHAAPRLLPPAGVEADRRDRRRPGRQHRAGVRDPRRRLLGQRDDRAAARRRARSSRARPPPASCARRRHARRRRPPPHAAATESSVDAVGEAVGAHKGTPVALTVRARRRGDDRPRRRRSTTTPEIKRWRFGFGYDREASARARRPGPRRAASRSSEMWRVTSSTVSHIAQIFVPEKRKEIGSVVGGYETTRQAIELDATTALVDPRASSRSRSA